MFHVLTNDGKLWVVEDIVIDEVSLVENYREQFNRIIADKGFAELLKKMASQLVKIGGKRPQATVSAPTDGQAAQVPAKKIKSQGAQSAEAKAKTNGHKKNIPSAKSTPSAN